MSLSAPVTIEPVAFGELRVCGCGEFVTHPRPMPIVANALLRRGDEVFWPPFVVHAGFLQKAGFQLSYAEFETSVRNGDATRVAETAAREDGCLVFPVGTDAPVYLSLADAATKVRCFAEEKAAAGDALLQAGRSAEALSEYELAAATAQAPEYYARMLLVPLSEKRRARIEDALAQVATLNPPMLHVEQVRTLLGLA